MLAASILLATILVLVDKNHQWKNFWRVLGVLVLLTMLSIGGFYANEKYQTRNQHQLKPWEEAAQQKQAWQDYQPPPPPTH